MLLMGRPLYINMVYTYYMVCVTYVQIGPARPPRSLNGDRQTFPNGNIQTDFP